MLNFKAVNWLAVLVAGIASFFLGGLWYSVLFATPWMRYVGMDPDAVEAGGGAQMVAYFGGAFATYLVAVGALAFLLTATGAASARQGLITGLLVGVGIVAAVSFNNYLFAGRPFGLYLIDMGYPVLALALSGAILGAWR